MKKLFKLIVVFAIGVTLGLGLAKTERGSSLANSIKSSGSTVASRTLEKVVGASDSLGTRELVLMENPALIKAIMKGGAFGGEFSQAAAQDMFGRYNEKAIKEVRELSRIEQVAPRTWMLYLPIVNAVLFETDAGLVLVDSGMAPAGPAIAELIKSVSDKPLHTIIYTHGHVDHAYGTWALLGDKPQIVAQQAVVQRFDRYIRLRGSMAKFMSQPLDSLPAVQADLVYPTVKFDKQLELVIGGEKFLLVHHRGETDDQLYVWVESRKALVSADYYQGFFPNAGNGKRQQRYVEEWAKALHEMAALEAELLLPAHGVAITDSQLIKENLSVHGDALQFIVDYTIEELNKGTRKDLIPQKLDFPAKFANHPSLNVQYVSPGDVSKMVIRQYTGWWDEIPSHWTPASYRARALEIVSLSGGIDTLVARAKALIYEDIVLASHLADWAWFAAPDNPGVQQLVVDVYSQRIVDKKSNTMEILAYVDQVVLARQRQLDAK